MLWVYLNQHFFSVMHLKHKKSNFLSSFSLFGVLTAALSASRCVAEAIAQGVLVTPPVFFEPLTQSPVSGTNELAGGGLIAGSGLSGNRELLNYGLIHLRPHFSYTFMYADGIQPQPGQPSDTFSHSISPGLLFELGPHWTLDYTPSLQFYSNRRFQDSVAHSVSLAGQTTYKDWNLGISQGYSSSSSALIETGSQTDQENYSTSLSAAHQFNTKLSLELGLAQNFRFADRFTNLREWSTSDWLNYQLLPRLSAGVGGGLGYDDVSLGSNMLYEQAQGRIIWLLGTKLSLTVSGGIDDRQLLDSESGDLINPIFGASIQYHLFEPTTFSLSATRTVNASYFENQASENTSVSAGIQQRLLGKLQLGINGGHATADYVATSSQISANRSDDYYFYGAQLNLAILKRGTIGVFYQHSENSSNQGGFGYSSNQSGVTIGYAF